MIYLLLLTVCLLMILYGLIRFAIAKKRSEVQPAVHILWVPGAAFLYSIFMAMLTAIN